MEPQQNYNQNFISNKIDKNNNTQENYIMYLKCVTGGLNADVNAILGISAMLELNGKIIGTFDVKIKPNPNYVIDTETLYYNDINFNIDKNNNLIILDLDSGKYVSESVAYSKFIDRFINGIGRGNKKITIVACNSYFHTSFLKAFIGRNARINDCDFYNIFNIPTIDIQSLYLLSNINSKSPQKVVSNNRYNMTDMCDYLNVYLPCQDRLGMVNSIRSCYHELLKLLIL